ncbi:MAG: hypothetical protein WCO35_00655 [Candidatus Nomurabacteria bacterium]
MADSVNLVQVVNFYAKKLEGKKLFCWKKPNKLYIGDFNSSKNGDCLDDGICTEIIPKKRNKKINPIDSFENDDRDNFYHAETYILFIKK